jgi:4-hydroxyacetophenone monooxygenase
MQVIGRDGIDLVSYWGGNPKAFKGLMVTGFPNFYCLYGPNSNIVVGSSIIFFVECQLRYVMGCLKLQLEKGVHAIECRQDVMDRYNLEIDALNRQRAWGVPSVNSWYKNSAGRVTQNWPGTHLQWWRETFAPDPEDFRVTDHKPEQTVANG